MSCPYFTEDYFGFCARSNSPYVPSIAEMERYCFKDSFTFCPIFEASSTKNEMKGYKNTWLHDIYSDPLILLKAQSKD
jgi:hypothetical protein